MSRSRGAGAARLLRAIEAMGVRSTADHWALVPPDVAKRLRPSVARVGDALLTAAGGSDALRMNRVIGLGHLGRARESMIDEIIAFYRAAKRRHFGIMLGPGPQAASVAGWLQGRGFTREPGHSLLVRDARMAVAVARSDARVRRARRREADTVIAINERSFSLPASRRAWSRAGLAARRNEHYLAFVGKIPVAVGALRIDDDLAWIGAGATLTRWRRHGAHTALIAARLRRAARRGCRWVWVETGSPVPGRPSGSRRNLLRLGFEEVCDKPVFVWREQ